MGACREATVQTAEMWQLVPTETLPARSSELEAGRPQETGGAASGRIPSLA